MTSSEEKRKKAASIVTALMVVAICIGTCWTILYSWQAKNLVQELSIIGVSSTIAGAFFISGLLLGFIFGVAKPDEAGKKNVSTNLEQISEWLTKIIVGAGLAQLATLPGSLKEFGIYAKPLLGDLAYGEIFAIGILIYYLTCGFLGGYLLTKLFFLGLLEKDSNGSSNNTGKDDDKK